MPTIASTTVTSEDGVFELCDTSASPAPSYPPVPGTYTFVIFSGDLTGSTFTVSSANSFYGAVVETAATGTPQSVPTAMATSSPIAVQIGSYSVPGYTIASSGTAVSPTTGCVVMAEASPAPSPSASQPPINASGFAFPFSPTAALNGQLSGTGSDGGAVTAVSLASFSQFNGGSGSFTLDNGVVGNFTFGPTIEVTEDEVARLKALLRGRVGPARLFSGSR